MLFSPTVVFCLGTSIQALNVLVLYVLVDVKSVVVCFSRFSCRRLRLYEIYDFYVLRLPEYLFSQLQRFNAQFVLVTNTAKWYL